ncbi:MAG TPA: aminoglycoside phosphotransferase family protein [Pseudonocardiaceae bacterium]|jgi:aminoglycoside phosphotransferase (APT) family kinase protein|nr:aminoglycoside phosphotransferase family protein [Pseudonocardiaceae bacterium]
MRWLPESSVPALTDALLEAAPELAGLPITMPKLTGREDPQWRSGSALLGDEFVAKFAWSEPAALRRAHEIEILAALAESAVPFLPEVVAASTDPVLLVTRRVSGSSLFQVIASIDRDRAGAQLAEFLVALHKVALHKQPARDLPKPYAGETTAAIRDGLGRWLRPDQLDRVRDWCDWIDAVLAVPAEPVLVHGDLHGDNQVWQRDELRVVLDFETAGAAEPEFDLRAFPGTGPGVELLQATLRHYTGRALSIDRIMAWHLRNALGDALWRSRAGIPLPDQRKPSEWVEDLDARLSALGVEILG